MYPELIRALACVKQAAAEANAELGLLPEAKRRAIVAAAEIRAGALHEHFVVDVIQGGAGTSTNMNANVIANRLELMGHQRGDYQHLHPHQDVMAQPRNDATALKLAALWHQPLARGEAYLRQAFADRAEAFADVLKMGRTSCGTRCR